MASCGASSASKTSASREAQTAAILHRCLHLAIVEVVKNAIRAHHDEVDGGIGFGIFLYGAGREATSSPRRGSESST